MSDECQYVYKRDASWHARPRALGCDTDTGRDFIGKYHFAHPDDEARTACGRSAVAEFTANPATAVVAHLRCMRPGCKQRWASI